MNGSIGVITEGLDDTEALKKEGYVRHVITNHEAKQKAAGFETAEGRDTIQKHLEAVYDVFKSRVSAGFNITEKQIDGLQGRVVLAKEALEIGLLDEITDGQSNIGAAPITPASAGMKGHINMSDLKTLLAEHPAAITEVDKIKTEAFDAGKLSVETKIKTLSSYLADDSAYPAAVKKLVLQAINGDVSVDVVHGAVVAYDAFKEAAVSADAKLDSDGVPVTPPKAPDTANDGTISSEADYQAALKDLRGEV